MVTPSLITAGPADQSVPIFLISFIWVLEGAPRSPWRPLFSRVNTPSSLVCLHRRGSPVLRASLWPPVDPLQQAQVSPVARTLELDTALQVRAHVSRVEGQNHLPCFAGHTAFEAAQYMVCFLSYKCIWPGLVSQIFHSSPWGFCFLRGMCGCFCLSAWSPYTPSSHVSYLCQQDNLFLWTRINLCYLVKWPGISRHWTSQN